MSGYELPRFGPVETGRTTLVGRMMRMSRYSEPKRAASGS
jgi:hypothetical protein